MAHHDKNGENENSDHSDAGFIKNILCNPVYKALLESLVDTPDSLKSSIKLCVRINSVMKS